LAISGDLTFNPEKDFLTGKNGEKFKLSLPKGEDLPSKGFDSGVDTYQAPAKDGNKVEVKIDPKSNRLQELKPFDPWDGKDFVRRSWFHV
jgi:aconitate hydratase